MRQVHQFYPTVAYGDGVSNEMLAVQRLLRRHGYESEIFCQVLPTVFSGRARHISEYGCYSSPDSVLLFHFSMNYPAQVLSWLKRIPDRKVLVYHNITPHIYFGGINTSYFYRARDGREGLAQLGALTRTAWGQSRFNCQELAECGWTDLAVLPLILDPARYSVRPNRRVLKRYRDGVNVLFVGRISPHKRFEDIILTFYHLKKRILAHARLLLVGSAHKMERYLEFLQTLVARLQLSDVIFTGHVSTAELVAYYRCADVYLSMSEHEGFGVPLLESMYLGVPIVAYKSTAVPETLADSGILVTEKNHRAVAELIGLLLNDPRLRARIVAGQRKRVQDFMPAQVEKRLLDLVHGLF